MKNTYNKEEKYVIGVDAGGTKTRAAAFDADGTIVSEAVTGCGNLVLSYDSAKSAIVSAIRNVWSDGCEYIAVGAAGASSGELAGRLSAELTAEFGVKTDVMSDAELALNAAFGPTADGMLVISGTGSVVFLRKNGTLLRAGGWGHILGDGGSAYCTGLLALQKLIHLHDCGETDERLQNAVFSTFGVSDVSGLVRYVYAPERTKADIARLGGLIALMAEEDHSISAEILWESAAALAGDAAIVLRRSGMTSVDVATTGGHIYDGSMFRCFFVNCLTKKTADLPHLNVLPGDVDPTRAAYRLRTNI